MRPPSCPLPPPRGSGPFLLLCFPAQPPPGPPPTGFLLQRQTSRRKGSRQDPDFSPAGGRGGGADHTGSPGAPARPAPGQQVTSSEREAKGPGDPRLTFLLSPPCPPGQAGSPSPLGGSAPAYLPSGKPTPNNLHLPKPSPAHRPASPRKPSRPPGSLLGIGADALIAQLDLRARVPEVPQGPAQPTHFTGEETEAQKGTEAKASWTQKVPREIQA